MPPTHRAYAFRWAAFASELMPLGAAITPEQLARYYDAKEDLGLGLTWQRFGDTRAVLGKSIASLGYFQSEADVLASIARVTPSVIVEGDALLKMLRAAADRGLGLYVTV